MTWPGTPRHNPRSTVTARTRPEPMRLYYDKETYGHGTAVGHTQRRDPSQPLRLTPAWSAQHQYRLLEFRHGAIAGARGAAPRRIVRAGRFLCGAHRPVHRTLTQGQVYRAGRGH